jgi:predicted transcriptional regulator
MGEQIKQRRESLNIQTTELARLIGVTSSLISQIEKAKAFPTVFALKKKFADALLTTVGKLIGEKETLSKNAMMRFSSVMYTANMTTIVQARRIVEPGESDPENIVTPGIFVKRVIEIRDPQEESTLVSEERRYPW